MVLSGTFIHIEGDDNMNINMTTKLSVGDTVFIPEYFVDTWIPSVPSIVDGITIRISKRGTEIEYWVAGLHGSKYCYNEKHCFESYESCLKECNRRNNGGKYND